MPLFKYSRSVINQVDVGLELPLVVVLAHMGAHASCTLPRVQALCKMQDLINSAITLPVTMVSSDVLVPSRIVGGFNIPRVAVAADMQTEASVALFTLRVDCVIQVLPSIRADFNVPLVAIAGSVYHVPIISCDMVLPALAAHCAISRSIERQVSGNILIPCLRVSAVVVSTEGYQYPDEGSDILRYGKQRRLL